MEEAEMAETIRVTVWNAGRPRKSAEGEGK
jgi:hypothetical protein